MATVPKVETYREFIERVVLLHFASHRFEYDTVRIGPAACSCGDLKPGELPATHLARSIAGGIDGGRTDG